MFHHELESGKLLLSSCPDSIKLVTTHAISFIAEGETRQKGRWRDEEFWWRLEMLQAGCGECPCCSDGAVGLQDTS